MVTPVMTSVFQWYFNGISTVFRYGFDAATRGKSLLVLSSAKGKDHGFKR